MPELSDLTWPKRTARLLLRPTHEADLDRIFQIRQQPTVSRWMTDLSADWEQFRARMLEPEHLSVTITIERAGDVIGDLMLRVADSWAQTEVKDQASRSTAEIGWALDPAEAGQGYATEAAKELLRIAFEELGLIRVTALCFAANEPSWRLMERIGMRREGYYVQDSLHREHGWLDGMSYAILAHEWA